MRPQVILVVVTVAVLGVLAALPLGGAAGSSSSWPCCDDCGACNRKFPPECQCNDISVNGCHPGCKNCVRNALAAAADGDGVQKLPGGGPGPVRTYRCADVLTNFCQRRCTPAPAHAAFIHG